MDDWIVNPVGLCQNAMSFPSHQLYRTSQQPRLTRKSQGETKVQWPSKFSFLNYRPSMKLNDNNKGCAVNSLVVCTDGVGFDSLNSQHKQSAEQEMVSPG